MLTTIISYITVLIVFGVLILIHEAGHLIAAKRAGIRVDAFSLGMGKRLCGFTVGDTDYRLSLIPFGGFCKLAGEDPSESEGGEDEMSAKPVGHRFWVIAAGPLTNYFFAFILFSVVFMLGVPTLSNKVGQVLNGYPAEKAGITAGDRIISVNGKEIEYWDDVLASINTRENMSSPLAVEVERGGQLKYFRITPDIIETTNIFRQTIKRPMMGVAPASELTSVSFSPGKAFYYGGKKLLEYTAMTYKMLWLVVTKALPAKESLSGPIGIVFFIKEAAHAGLVSVLLIMAHISMALAIFNMLPLPPLDGGHILFLALEKIRKKAVSFKVQEIVTNTIFAMLLVLIAFVTWNDILKFTPIGKLPFFQGEKVVAGEQK